MALRGKDNNETFLREQARMDQGKNVLEMGKQRLRDYTGPSYDYAWKELRAGRPGGFIMKSGGTALGAVVIGHGLYNVLSGMDEPSQDLFLADFHGSNLTRIFTGLTEVGIGCAMMFAALTKGHFKGK